MYFKSLLSVVMVWLLSVPLWAQVHPSDEGVSHWYYITSTSSRPYCRGKVVYNTSPRANHQMRWGDRTKDVNAMWKFVSAGKGGYYIINKGTGYYMCSTSVPQKAGRALTTNDKSKATVFYLHRQGKGKNSFVIKGEGQSPIHADQNSLMVTWPDEHLGSASSWCFDEISASDVASATRLSSEWRDACPLVWSDEFDGTTSDLDVAWNQGEGFLRNQEAQWYQGSNSSVSSGSLRIEGRRESRSNPWYDADYLSKHKSNGNSWKYTRPRIEYTSSQLTTAGKVEFMYGRLEVRAKIPIFGGAWPAIWTLGNEVPGTDYHWPHSGEVDLMEYYGGTTLANLVWGSPSVWTGTWESRKTTMDYWHDQDPSWEDRFHTWRMDWDAESIKLYLDDELLTICNLDRTGNKFGTTRGSNPFRDHFQYILLNLALGGQSGGKIDNSKLPATYEVDYVRLYQKQGQQLKLNLNTMESVTPVYEKTYQKGKINTLCLPYDLTKEEMAELGGSFYALSSEKDGVMHFKEVDNTEAFKPYLFVSDETSKCLSPLANKVPQKGKPIPQTVGSMTFVGTVKKQVVRSTDNENCFGYNAADGKLTQINTTTGANLSAYHCYFYSPKLLTAAKRLVLESEVITGVHKVGVTSDRPGAIYALDGRVVRQNGSVENLPAGIYIQNRKKIVIK